MELYLYLLHIWKMCCFIASYLDANASEAMVRLEDLIRIIFQELDPIQL